MTEADGIRQRKHPRKMWWDGVRQDVKSFGLSCEAAQDQNTCRRKVKGYVESGC